MKSIGIFGGTFNPIHSGHINLINKVCERFILDKIIIIPTKIPPHKVANNLASESDRFEMCRLAFEDNSQVEISDYEFSKTGKSYTIFTLRHFKKMYPKAKIFLIMGSDMILSFHKWLNYDEILKLATIIAFPRGSNVVEKMLDYSGKIEGMGGECLVVPITPFEISSTKIRESILKNEDLTCYLPEKVVKYIELKKLYK